MQGIEHTPNLTEAPPRHPSLIEVLDGALTPTGNVPADHPASTLDLTARRLFNEIGLPQLVLSACIQFSGRAHFEPDELWWVSWHNNRTPTEDDAPHPQDTFSGVGIDLGEQYGSLFLGLFNACERLSKKSYLMVAHAPPWHDVACRPDTAMLSMRVQTCVMGSVLLQHLSPLQQRLHHSYEERGLPLAGYASETSEYSLHKESILWSHTLTVFWRAAGNTCPH